jgi:uncharacterized protein
MSKRKHTRDRIDNSYTDLIAAVKVAATGGSQLSGYNTTAFSNNYALITLNRIILTYLYSGNGLFQTAVQLPIQDALAKGIKIESGEMAQEDIDQILDWFDDHGVWQLLEDYWTWVRVYGGGAIILNNDTDPDTPLNMRRLKNAPIEFYDIDRWQLSVTTAPAVMFDNYDDMTAADILYLNGQPVHSSRCIIGTGKRAPSYIRRQLRGWGMSEAERMLRDLNNYLKTGDVLYEILDESKIDVYKIEGLANHLLTAGGVQSVTRRIQAANEVKNYVNALILDSKEEYEQKTLTFAGLADVMRENRIGVASALRMPMTKLFGLSASGFSTGESDTDNYNEMVESEIRSKIKPSISRMVEIACYNLWGYCPSFRLSFPSLKVISQSDHETIKASATSRILALYDRGLITSPQAGELLAKDEVIDSEIAQTFSANPMPPNGAESVAPIDGESVNVFKKAGQAIGNAARKIKRK